MSIYCSSSLTQLTKFGVLDEPRIKLIRKSQIKLIFSLESTTIDDTVISLTVLWSNNFS